MLSYGSLLQATLDFLILAFCVFLIVKAVNAAKRKEAPAPAPPPEVSAEVKLLAEIRDQLKARG